MSRRSLLVIPCLVAIFGSAKLAADVLAPPPAWARSATAVDEHVPVYAEPRAGARRRGTIAEGTRVSFTRRLPGTGCHTSVWLELEPGLYACEELFQLSSRPPEAVPQPPGPENALLPLDYVAVTSDGAHAYSEPSQYFADDFVETLGQGFVLVADRERVLDGVRFLHLARGTWMAAESLRHVRGSAYEGIWLDRSAPPKLAWTRRRDVPVFDAPRGRIVRRAPRREVVEVEAIDRRFARLADGTYVRVEDLNRVTIAEPPEGLSEGERWIDVSISEQVLVAYEGATPVFATLVSTGADSADRKTPLGTFRIWAKLATSDMQHLDAEDSRELYLVERVPWVQYFEGSVGLHAAFWHDDFGHRRSHGCVNLSPRDARTLFDFTRPVLRPGFEAFLPAREDPSTIVRVRE